LTSFPADDRIHLLEFVSDVRPLYVEANLVLVPTLVSAGTNLKVLEAMAMERAVVSTLSGCAGLGLEDGVNVWVANKPEDIANAIQTLLQNQHLRRQLASAGRAHVQRNFGWQEIGCRQRSLISKVLPSRIQIRRAGDGDLAEIASIQATASEASQWQAQDYLAFDCRVAMLKGRIAGFVVSRQVADQEREILNVAVHPNFRRLGIASDLLRAEITRHAGIHFLEVRESNAAARQLYERLGFQVVGARPEYYDNPNETGIVMRIFS
jgi:ribosomal-protein-alanine acetyltransferase